MSTKVDHAMSLNIKDPEVHRLARTLAEQTGETMTDAVKLALRERLERAQRRRRPEAIAAELLAIGRRCAKTLQGRRRDHGEILYDERGIPR